MSSAVADFATEAVARVRRSVVQVRGTGSAASAGTGIVWGHGTNGLVVTNAHVAVESPVIVVGPDGRDTRGRVIYRDPIRDLAVIDGGFGGWPPALTADPASLRAGALLFAVGHRLGVRDAVSVGVFNRVGPLAGAFQLPASQRGLAWVQADVELAPGNSGGPLADADARVVGVAAMVTHGLALAIPASEVDALFARVG